jgi:hypothetical protein
MLPGLFLLHLRQPISERAGIVRVRGHGGDEEQQRQQGAAGSGDYAGGAPAEPGIPGSRRGVKPASLLKGAGAPLGAFSFFFFFTSRLPLSRDFAMVPCLPDLVRGAAIVPAMGLDVYVGSLTRYYLHDWETVIQQLGREQGIPVEIRHSEPSPPDELKDAAEIRETVSRWRAGLKQALHGTVGDPFDWDESPDAPYFTDKPDWDGYGGMLLLAAHDENPQLKPPKTISKQGWKDDQALRVSSDPTFPTRYAQILAPEWWLPWDFDWPFEGMAPSLTKRIFGSAPALLRQLTDLNTRTFRGTSAQLAEWANQPIEGGDGPFAQAARLGLAIFLDLTQKAVVSRLPMLLDY